MSIPLLSSDEIIKKLQAYSYTQKKSYLAMYSSWYGGIITDASMMMVPIDDHLVHRGDGVFEAMKSVNGKIYLFDDHLDRLENSSKQLGMASPFGRETLKNIIHETLKAAHTTTALIRLFMSRGPGGFTTNPYDSIGVQLYIVITELKNMAEEKYQSGVKIGKSHIIPKEPWFATIKSCNYLPNVLMKKEAVDRGLDFTVGFDGEGIMTESSTENIVLLDQKNILVRPQLKGILRGTTMMRAFHLADTLVTQKQIAAVEERDLTEKDILAAKEVMMIGTTLDVLPATEYEGHKIAGGQVGPVAQALRRLIQKDQI